MQEPSCLGFGVECGVLFKGAGVVLAGFTLFIGSVYVLLSAVFGRWMGYLVLMVCFAGWMMIQSSLWLFGFWSQGLETPTNLGPRGAEAAWIVLAAGLEPGAAGYATFDTYPGDPPWAEPGDADAADVQSVSGVATTFLAEQTNEELGRDPEGIDAIPPTQFTVDAISLADADDGTPLAVVKAHYNGGGPETTLSMYYDTGSVPRYSYMFLGGSIVLFLLHLPLLDRAEKKRKAFLTGGDQPPWYGPA
jgi:hypothetical protein